MPRSKPTTPRDGTETKAKPPPAAASVTITVGRRDSPTKRAAAVVEEIAAVGRMSAMQELSPRNRPHSPVTCVQVREAATPSPSVHSVELSSTASEFRPPTRQLSPKKSGGRYAHITAKVDSFRTPPPRPSPRQSGRVLSPEKKLSYVIKRPQMTPSPRQSSPYTSASANTLIAQMEQNMMDSRKSPVSPFSLRTPDGHRPTLSLSRRTPTPPVHAPPPTHNDDITVSPHISYVSCTGASTTTLPQFEDVNTTEPVAPFMEVTPPQLVPLPALQEQVSPLDLSPDASATDVIIQLQPDADSGATVDVLRRPLSDNSEQPTPRPLVPSPMPDVPPWPTEQGDIPWKVVCSHCTCEKPPKAEIPDTLLNEIPPNSEMPDSIPLNSETSYHALINETLPNSEMLDALSMDEKSEHKDESP